MSARNYLSAREKNNSKLDCLPNIKQQKFGYRSGHELPPLSANTSNLVNRNLGYSYDIQSFIVNGEIQRAGTPFSDFFSESETGTPDFRSEESDSSSGSVLRRNTAEASRTLAQEWERIERTLYDEDGDKSTRPQIIEECKQWRKLHPQLRLADADNLCKWGYAGKDENKFDCGAIEIMAHLTDCSTCPDTCTHEDLYKATDFALGAASATCPELILDRVVGKAIRLPEKRLSCRQVELHDEIIAQHYSDYEQFSESEERLSQSSTDVTPQNSPRVSVCENLSREKTSEELEPRLSREKVSFFTPYIEEPGIPDTFSSLLHITPIQIRSPVQRKRYNPSILKSDIASSRWMRSSRPDSSVNCDRNSAKSFVSLDTRNYGNVALSASERNKMLNSRVLTARHRDLTRLEPLYTPEVPHNDMIRLQNGLSHQYNIRKVSLPPLLLEEEKKKVAPVSSAKKYSKTRKSLSKTHQHQLDRTRHNN